MFLLGYTIVIGKKEIKNDLFPILGYNNIYQ